MLSPIGIDKAANLNDGSHTLLRHSAVRACALLRIPFHRETGRSAPLPVRQHAQPVVPAARQQKL